MKKMTQWIIITFAFLAFHSAFADQTNPEVKAVQDAYYAWCNAIGKAKGNPHEVVKFYAHDAILLPTLSNKIMINTEGGLDEYFKKLTSLPNIKCVPEKLMTRMFTDTAVNTGLYQFTYTEKGRKKVISARFTFVYQKYGDKWLINKHHSSKSPTK